MALTKAQLIDLNANEMIIDLDGDTSITADTDDQIDIKIAGADDFRFTANTFTALSGSTIAAQALTATSLTTTGAIAIPNDGNIGSAGDADAIAISSSGVVTFSQSPVFPDGSINVADIDLDGATDIGAALADADLFLIDDGAGGTMRKATASCVKTYMGASAGAFSVENLDIDGSTDIGANLADADLFIVDDGAGGTNRKVAASRIKTYIGGGTQWQAVKTSNYTAAAGQGVFANTTSGSFTVTLPAGTLGDEVTIVDYAGTFDSNALTVAANGAEKIFGSTDDLTVSTERAAFTLVFTDSTQGWLFKND